MVESQMATAMIVMRSLDEAGSDGGPCISASLITPWR
jgi:hypothetical protein